MASKDQPEQQLQAIWNAWWEPKGPCANCPSRDRNAQKQPYYGLGDLNAEIVFVAKEPDSRESQHGDVSKWDDLPSSFAKRHASLDSFEENFLVTSRIPREFIESLDVVNLQGDATGIYYTNATKCGSVKGNDNETARRKCRTHLATEMQAINPTVIVPFGNGAKKSVFELYDIPGADRGITKLALDIHGDGKPHIAPSIHWSYLSSNLKHMKEVDSEQEYWDQLAAIINSVESK